MDIQRAKVALLRALRQTGRYEIQESINEALAALESNATQSQLADLIKQARETAAEERRLQEKQERTR